MQYFCESVLEILLSKPGTRIAKEGIKMLFPFAEQEPDKVKRSRLRGGYGVLESLLL